MQAFSRKSNRYNKLLFTAGTRDTELHVCFKRKNRLNMCLPAKADINPIAWNIIASRFCGSPRCRNYKFRIMSPTAVAIAQRPQWKLKPRLAHHPAQKKIAEYSVTIELRISVFQLKGIAAVQHHLWHCGLILLVTQLFACAVLHQGDEAPHGDHQGAGDAQRISGLMQQQSLKEEGEDHLRDSMRLSCGFGPKSRGMKDRK